MQVSGSMNSRAAGYYGQVYPNGPPTLWYELPLPGGLTAEQAVWLYRQDLERQLHPEPLEYGNEEMRQQDAREGEEAREDLLAALETLRGKNLACWCPPSQACHADVLLELANA